jgi:uncharacterized protein
MAIKDDPILKRFRAELDKVYGDRLDRVVLFGSRARGDARPDSDYDIAVFLRDPESFWDESGRLAEIEVGLMDRGQAVIHALPFHATDISRQTLFMNDVRQEGIEI